MINILKTFFINVPQLVKLKPIIFATLVFNAVYGLTNVIISTVELSFFIGTTGAYSLIFCAAKIYGLTKLKKVQETQNTIEAAEIEKKAATNLSIYAASMSFLHFSFAIVCIFFFEENPSNYQLWFIYFIGGAAVIKIIIASVNSIRTRKNHSIIIYHLKLMDFANALISLALLQRAILYYLKDEQARIIGGIGGVFFSLCAILICVKMFFKFYKKTNTKN